MMGFSGAKAFRGQKLCYVVGGPVLAIGHSIHISDLMIVRRCTVALHMLDLMAFVLLNR